MMVVSDERRCYKIYHIFLRERGSRPDVGSSKISNRGLLSRAMENDNFRFVPPLSSLAILLNSSSIPTLATILSIYSLGF